MKKCFFYWGGDKMPLLNVISLISFRKYNPDYKIILYTPLINYNESTWKTDEQKVKYTGENYFYITNYVVDEIRVIDLEDLGFNNNIHNVQKSDILRQWLMLNEGGWWSDMDVVWVKSISKLGLESNYDLGVCWRNDYHSSGIMYSRPQTNFYKIIFNNLKTLFDRTNYQSAGPDILNILFPGIDLIEKTEENIRVYNFEHYNFSPLDWTKFHLLYENGDHRNILTDDVYGIHWYNGGRSSGNFLNIFDVGEIETSDVLIYKIIKNTLGYDIIKKYIKNCE